MGLLLLGVGCAAIFAFPAFPIRLAVACLMVFLVDAFGGRWFGYTAIPFIAVGLLNDTAGNWILVLPLLLGAFWAALFLRHVEPGWFGVPLGMIGFVVPLFGLLFLQQRIDPNIQLPLKGQFTMYYVASGTVAILVSSVVLQLLRRSRVKPVRRIAVR